MIDKQKALNSEEKNRCKSDAEKRGLFFQAICNFYAEIIFIQYNTFVIYRMVLKKGEREREKDMYI